MAELIPRLREKFDVMIAHSDLSGRAQIANALDVAESTVRWYEKGNPVRDPGMVPAGKIEPLVRLIRRKMPGNRSAAEIRHLLFGPLEAFASAFTASPGLRWPSFLSEFSEEGLTVQIVGEVPQQRGAAILERPEAERGIPVLPHKCRFRLEYSLTPRLAGIYWITFLQHDAGGWDVLPCGEENAIGRNMGAVVQVPSPEPLSYRFRHSTDGLVRFVAIASRKPYPDDYLSAASEEGRLTSPALDRLAFWLNQLNRTDWTGSTCRVSVEFP